MGHFVVTGGSSGLGAAVVSALIAEGHHVAVLSRKAAAKRDSGVVPEGALAIDCDVREDAAVRDAFGEAESAFGMPVEGVVNAAGVIEREWFLRQSPAVWRTMIDTNLFGTLNVCREAARRMQNARTHGSIVNIASVAGSISLEKRAVYSASKAAVIQFSRCLALELARDEIRVN